MNEKIAIIAVDNTFFSFDTDYSYSIPGNISNLEVGCRVNVPFGKGNKLRNGIVLKIVDGDSTGLKEIDSIVDKPLTEEMVKLALWLKERCFCTTYDCLKQMLPRRFGNIKDKSLRMVRLCSFDESSFANVTKKQKLVCDLLMDVGTAGVDEVCEFCSVGVGVIKNLEKNGIVEIFQKEIYRNPYRVDTPIDKTNISLSTEQQNAFNVYKNMLHSGGVGLLFGVTGSGKTQVYLKLIEEVVFNQKRDAIVLVPEISLTPQTLSIFHKRFGDLVAVIHSGLSLGERNDEFKRIDRGEAKIVIGTRSAVFAPTHNLGLIVMDEEQEHTYKSERTPKYNAKDVAKFRAKYNNALFLMSSATPSIESYSFAKSGKYTLCELTQRYGKSVLPEVITIDMKKEMKLGNKTSISSKLRELLQETIDNDKQAILLINRRGYNTFIACDECGHIVTCPNCSISMTYHKYNNRLVCHYCGYSKSLDTTCPNCGADGIRYSGYGTQRIEQELEELLTNAKILRMDADTTSTKFAHEKLLEKFKNKEFNILIGTQMVAKGLDFDNVNLVGVVNADNSLYDESYTAFEKSFDLITQVIGRAGRRDTKGMAIVQTINPFNEVIEYASNQDYLGFYNNEIAIRKAMTYPPFCDIFAIIFSGENENSVCLCAKRFFELLKEYNTGEFCDLKLIVLGPTPAKISKINNNYRYRIAIKCKNSKKIRLMLSLIIKDISKDRNFKDVMLGISQNPADIS